MSEQSPVIRHPAKFVPLRCRRDGAKRRFGNTRICNEPLPVQRSTIGIYPCADR